MEHVMIQMAPTQMEAHEVPLTSQPHDADADAALPQTPNPTTATAAAAAAAAVDDALNLLAQLFHPRPEAMPIIDPELKTYGRVWIPLAVIHPTSGVDRYLAGHPYPPSLCLLFQSGRCNAGSRCNQIHPDPQYVLVVRTLFRAIKSSNCCLGHLDLPSFRPDFREMMDKLDVFVVSEDHLRQVQLERRHIAVTTFWDSPPTLTTTTSDGANPKAKMIVRILPNQICKLHQQSSCKYGIDCKRVHLCREFWSQWSSVFAPVSSSLTMRGPHHHHQHEKEGTALMLEIASKLIPGAASAAAAASAAEAVLLASAVEKRKPIASTTGISAEKMQPFLHLLPSSKPSALPTPSVTVRSPPTAPTTMAKSMTTTPATASPIEVYPDVVVRAPTPTQVHPAPPSVVRMLMQQQQQQQPMPAVSLTPSPPQQQPISAMTPPLAQLPPQHHFVPSPPPPSSTSEAVAAVVCAPPPRAGFSHPVVVDVLQDGQVATHAMGHPVAVSPSPQMAVAAGYTKTNMELPSSRISPIEGVPQASQPAVGLDALLSHYQSAAPRSPAPMGIAPITLHNIFEANLDALDSPEGKSSSNSQSNGGIEEDDSDIDDLLYAVQLSMNVYRRGSPQQPITPKTTQLVGMGHHPLAAQQQQAQQRRFSSFSVGSETGGHVLKSLPPTSSSASSGGYDGLLAVPIDRWCF